MAAPPFGTISANLAGSNSTTAAVPIAASVTLDDIILVPLYVESGAQVVTKPAAFTECPNSPITVTGTDAHVLHVYWKRQTSATGAGETTGTYAFSVASGLVWRTGCSVRFTGCVTTEAPFNQTAQAIKTTNTNGVCPNISLTTTQPCQLVYIASSFSGATLTTVTGFTERIDPGQYAVDTLAQTVAGATGTLTATFSTNCGIAVWLGALKALPDTAAAPAIVSNKSLTVAVRRAGFY